MKATKVETFYDKYFNTVVYEYRGHKYEVEYANDLSCCVTPAWIQHRIEQEKIDDILDNHKAEKKVKAIPFDEQMDIIYEMLEW